MLKVFYTASYYGKSKFQKYYDYVRKSIEENKVKLISPELGNHKILLDKKIIEKISDNKRLHYEAIKMGILWADAVVIEISNEDFQLGHEATLAIMNKKPVLCLSIFEDYSEKIINPYFYSARYNEFNINNLVKEFLDKCKKDYISERFNCFLTKNELEYLENVSKEQGLNKSEYLRKLIDEDMRF